jgi:sporulation protein YlmC with PRC-barrel domain
MKRLIFASATAVCVFLCLNEPSSAEPAGTRTTDASSAGDITQVATKPAQGCLSDLRTFSGEMQKGGYWLGASDYGYGYPMGGLGFGYAYPMIGYPLGAANSYPTARSGYKIRTLIASANILAQNGQQQICENVLETARGFYKTYAADMQDRKVATADGQSWQQQQITAARAVTGQNVGFRSDQLLEADVRGPQNEALGSVHDLIMSPQTGKIAYLVIGRGGIFGIDEKYVPVPWEDFKVTGNLSLVVLDATKAAMDAAPKVSDDEFAAPANFDRESRKVDAYWKTHLTN